MSGAEEVIPGTPVLLRRDGAALEVVMDRPEKRNAISTRMIDALHAALDTAERERPAVLAVRGSGGHFCAGADIAVYTAGDQDAIAAFIRSARALCDRIEETDTLVVAIVDGVCLGGGFELALASDLVIAADTARFGFPEAALGLIPGWGGTQRLTRAVGRHRAMELTVSGTLFDAARALELGLVTRTSPAGTLDDAAAAYLTEVAGRAPLAVRAAKRAVRLAPTPAGAEVETSELLSLFRSPDGVEGVSAFTQKRRPRFGSGRAADRPVPHDRRSDAGEPSTAFR